MYTVHKKYCLIIYLKVELYQLHQLNRTFGSGQNPINAWFQYSNALVTKDTGFSPSVIKKLQHLMTTARTRNLVDDASMPHIS